jgi:hypothetical protein
MTTWHFATISTQEVNVMPAMMFSATINEGCTVCFSNFSSHHRLPLLINPHHNPWPECLTYHIEFWQERNMKHHITSGQSYAYPFSNNTMLTTTLTSSYITLYSNTSSVNHSQESSHHKLWTEYLTYNNKSWQERNVKHHIRCGFNLSLSFCEKHDVDHFSLTSSCVTLCFSSHHWLLTHHESSNNNP